MEPKLPAREDAPAEVVIRPAVPSDAGALWNLVLEFAAYEKLDHQVTGSSERLAAQLFGSAWPPLDCIVAESNGALVGYAIYYGGFSTFWTRPLLWLEDLFVVPSHRGRGLGRALMVAVARAAIERGCARIEWAVLDWNAPSIAFYERLGATRHGGWHGYRLSLEQLVELAGETEGSATTGPAPPHTSSTT